MKKTTEKTLALAMAAVLCITTVAVPVDAKVNRLRSWQRNREKRRLPVRSNQEKRRINLIVRLR